MSFNDYQLAIRTLYQNRFLTEHLSALNIMVFFYHLCEMSFLSHYFLTACCVVSHNECFGTITYLFLVSV